MIISCFDVWLIETIISIKTALGLVGPMSILILLFIITMDVLLKGEVLADILPDIFSKYVKRSTLLVMSAGIASLMMLLPSYSTIEHWIVDKYATPSNIEKFKSEDAFYNQLGYELSNISILKNNIKLPLRKDGGTESETE